MLGVATIAQARTIPITNFRLAFMMIVSMEGA